MLAELPAGVFAGLTSLTGLRLENNMLADLPDDVFEPLTSLTDLRLSGNPEAPFAPEAVALPDDGTVDSGFSGGTVTLDGSGSGGAWGTNVSYSWALTDPASGVDVLFDDNTSVTPQVAIPALRVDTDLTFTFTLTVTGRGGTERHRPRDRHRHRDGERHQRPDPERPGAGGRRRQRHRAEPAVCPGQAVLHGIGGLLGSTR